MNSIDKAKTIAKILDNKQGIDIKILKVGSLTVLTEYFVICAGASTTQVKALADEVDFIMGKDYKTEPRKIEGYNSDGWILLDYSDVVVHVFHKNKRGFYDIERIWADSQEIDF
ncbi:MAG: ribosome silencing factor [Oscillospiraceae bacterium]